MVSRGNATAKLDVSKEMTMEHNHTATKRCSKCGEVKPVEEFNKDKSKKDGRQGYCRACQRASKRTPKYKAYEETPERKKYKSKWNAFQRYGPNRLRTLRADSVYSYTKRNKKAREKMLAEDPGFTENVPMSLEDFIESLGKNLIHDPSIKESAVQVTKPERRLMQANTLTLIEMRPQKTITLKRGSLKNLLH
jgi:hypothetical protein